MSRAFATIANGGERVDGSLLGNRPRVIEQVEHVRSGKRQVEPPVDRQVLTQAEAAKLTSILEDVVSSGTGRRAQIPGAAVAGKTGTTDNYGDAWFVGYTPKLVAAVWVGYPDELRPMETEFGGEPVAGGTLPAMIWKEFQTQALGAPGGERRPVRGRLLHPGDVEADRQPRRVEARQRLLPEHPARRLLRGPWADAVRGLQAERGARAARRRLVARVRP